MSAEQLQIKPVSFQAKFVFERHGLSHTTYEEKVSDIVSEMEEVFAIGSRNIALLELATDNAKSYSSWLSQIYATTNSWELAYVLHTAYPLLAERFGRDWALRYKPKDLVSMAKEWKTTIISGNTGTTAYRMACYRAIDVMKTKVPNLQIQYEKSTPGAYDENFSEYEYFEDVNQLKESHTRITESACRRNRTIAQQVTDLYTVARESGIPIRVCVLTGPAHNNLFTLLTPELLAVSSAKTEAILGNDHQASIDRFIMRNAAGLDISDKEWLLFQEKLGRLKKSV